MAQEYRPKPALAAWIQRERKRLRLTAAQLVERLGLYDINVSEQTIRVWESNAGRRPSAQNLDALERIFGSQAPDRAAAPEGTSAIVAAINEQTRAIEALTALLADRLEAQTGAWDGYADGLQALLTRLVGEHARNVDEREPQPVETP